MVGNEGLRGKGSVGFLTHILFITYLLAKLGSYQAFHARNMCNVKRATLLL